MINMGKIANYIKRKSREFSQDRERRKTLNEEVKVASRDAYNQSYKTEAIAQARRQGKQAAQRGGESTFGQIGNYAQSFSKAGEEMFGFGTLSKATKKGSDPYSDVLGFTLGGKRKKKKKRRSGNIVIHVKRR